MIFTPILAPANKFAGTAKEPRIKPAREANGKMRASHGARGHGALSYCFYYYKHASAF
jgi:hypothetical protein